MDFNERESSCARTCWRAAILVGVLLALLLWLLGGWSFLGALLFGIIVAVVGGFVLKWLLCGSETAGSGTTASAPAAAPAAEPKASGAAKAAAAGEAQAKEAPAPEAKPEATKETGTKAKSGGAKAAAGGAAASAVKPSKELPGQAELSSRKGSWKYEGEGASQAQAKPAAGKAAAAGAAPAPGAAGASAAAAQPGAGQDVDYDGDGRIEGTDEGTRPEGLSGPRGGQADNLKEIKGVGPKLEAMLNGMGYYHFDQIANWSADEVAWVNANLQGFKGRVSRDNWVEQAKILASGGETEFSQKVGKGGVYD